MQDAPLTLTPRRHQPPAMAPRSHHTVADYFAHYEPWLSCIRRSITADSSPIPTTGGAIIDYAPVIPLPNRAGRPTGRALTCSLEPGAIIDTDTRVDLTGTWTTPAGTVTVTGFFYIGFSPDLPEAQFHITGPCDLVDLVRDHLPSSHTVPRVSAVTLQQQIRVLRSSRRDAEDALYEAFRTLLGHKIQLISGYTSPTWSHEDALQEARAELARGIHLFASPQRPNTSLFAWVDLHVWRALERAMRQDAGLTAAGWVVRRWLLDQGFVANAPNPTATSLQDLAATAEKELGVSAAAAQEGIAHFFHLDHDRAPTDPTGEVPVDEALEALSRLARLSLRQRRVCQTRLLTGQSQPRPWREVASILGMPQPTCEALYGRAVRKIRAVRADFLAST